MEWISIKWRKPKAYQRVVTIRNSDITTAGIDFYTGSIWTHDGEWGDNQKVTHWMPLYEPQEEFEIDLGGALDLI